VNAAFDYVHNFHPDYDPTRCVECGEPEANRFHAHPRQELSVKVTCRSEIGDTVTVKHPRSRKPATGKVSWVSPTLGTVQVLLDDGTYAYEFPEDDGQKRPMSEKAKRWYAEHGGGFKRMVEAANEMEGLEL
jgi:hypothetical protein